MAYEGVDGGKSVMCTLPWPGEEVGGGKGESIIRHSIEGKMRR